MGIQYRKFIASDTESIKKQLEDLVIYMGKFLPMRRDRPLPTFKEMYFKYLQTRMKKGEVVIFVALEEAKIIGCIIGEKVKHSKDELTYYSPEQTGEIDEFYVEPEYRSKGIGMALIKLVENYFIENGIKKIVLWTPAGNEACEFYRRAGYQDSKVQFYKELS